MEPRLNCRFLCRPNKTIKRIPRLLFPKIIINFDRDVVSSHTNLRLLLSDGTGLVASLRILLLKAKFHYAILVADRSEAGRRPAAGSWNLAYHALSSSLVAS